MLDSVTPTSPHTRQRRLHELMRHRVRDVLLVSSLYDAYILQEDGHLTEQVYLEYRELRLSSAPRFSHAANAEQALEQLQRRRFDLVLIVSHLREMQEGPFATLVKERYPGVAVGLLAFDSSDYEWLRSVRAEPAIDNVFAWSGDAKILLATSKCIEDARNVDQDIQAADVRVILVVEDSIRYYSSFLSVLYPELMKQSQSLFSEGLNRLQKLLRMRTRPKVLLAEDYDQAIALYERYHDHLLAVISDVGYPRGDEHDPEAGLRLVRKVRRECPDLPILLQSAEEEFREHEPDLGVEFVNKSSPLLLQRIRRFLRDYLGFGPFIFRLPDGSEVCRASDVQELVSCIQRVPPESLEFHARRNHFSNWLLARSEFRLAEVMRPQGVEDFEDIEELRRVTVSEIRAHERTQRAGVIADLNPGDFHAESSFQRIGAGSLGGKARGIAFLDHLLSLRPEPEDPEALRVRIPQSFVVATNAFDEFLAANDLYFVATSSEQDEWIARRFLSARLPRATRDALRSLVAHVDYPLAVRSSSLLEDDMLHPFAGVYGTVMLANRATDDELRFAELEQAVKYIYASTFFRRAKRHLRRMGRRLEEEKMAVLIQQVCGRPHGDRYYPLCSGVAHSYNYYALPPQHPEEGAAQLVFGLSPVTAGGEARVRFCPARLELRPQYRDDRDRARFAQRSFLALDLRGRLQLAGAQPEQIIRRFDLTQGSEDATLSLAASRFHPDRGVLASPEQGPGELVVTFDELLREPSLPLASSLRTLLSLAASGIGMSVELEFALVLHDHPAGLHRGTLYPLQLRPVVRRLAADEGRAVFDPAHVVCRTDTALGVTPPSDLYDLVYVRRAAFFGDADPRRIAAELGAVNDRLVAEGRPYLLIGPGRWGDPSLGGVPVTWAQIAGVSVLVEVWPSGTPDGPPGAWFFDNLAANDVAYVTVPSRYAPEPHPEGPFLDWGWLESQTARHETAVLRCVRLDVPLTAWINDPQPGAVITRRPPVEARPYHHHFGG